MARGGKRSYVRDGNGRFASSPGGGGGKARPAARRAATRAGNRLNRDNAGRISGIGRDGATVRGGRIKTAKGARRATQTAALKAGGFRAGTIAKGGRGVSGSVARSLAAAKRERAGRSGVGAAKKGAAATPEAKSASRRRPPAESRLAAAYQRAERLAAQRQGQRESSYRSARGLQLDAFGIRGKKKREAALQSPEVQSAISEAQRRDSQAKSARQRAAGLRDAYLRRLGQGTGERGKVATKDRKRYDFLRESAYRLGQKISTDSHNLAYNTNSMGFKESEKARVRLERNKRRMQRKQALIKRLANVSSVSEAPTLPHAQAWGRPIKGPVLRPGRRSNSNRSSGVALAQSMPFVVRRDGRTMGSIYPQGQINTIRGKRIGGPGRLRKQLPKPAAPKGRAMPGGRTVYRTRSQAVTYQRARGNSLGRRTADSRGLSTANRARSKFYDPAPRTVIGRPRVAQLTLSGRTERVGAGRFRTIGERRAGGTTSRPRQGKPSPIRGSKAYEREVRRLIRQNGGKDVAAFRFP